MEKYEEFSADANKSYDVAFHMVNKTYASIGDPKILLATLEDVFNSYEKTLFAITFYLRFKKKVPAFNTTYFGALDVIRKVSKDYEINHEILVAMEEVKELLEEHKKAPVEFQRKDAFIIADENYKLKTIDEPTLKNYLNKAKLFIDKAVLIIKENA